MASKYKGSLERLGLGDAMRSPPGPRGQGLAGAGLRSSLDDANRQPLKSKGVGLAGAGLPMSLANVSGAELKSKGLGLADVNSPLSLGVAARGGGKLSRTETVTVRLDPKLRYLAELAARLHRRTLSSYVEWSIKASLDTEAIRPTNNPSVVANDHTIGSEAEYLWDVDEADRFAKLALRYPHLMTHEEQVRWKLIRECYSLWGDGVPWENDDRGIEQLNFAMLRRNWDLIQKAAAGGKTADDIDLDLVK